MDWSSESLRYQDYRRLTIICTAALALLVASAPFIQSVLVYPQTEIFTEVWLLGPGHMVEDYPFNITAGNSYLVFLGLMNHLGHLSYYQVQVKLRNQTQPGPDSFNRTSSSLLPLFTVNAFLTDNETWEMPVRFSFNFSFAMVDSRVYLDNMFFNDNTLDLSGYEVSLDPVKQQYLVNLFFEIWVYNRTSGGFNYHERYVGLWLNLQG